MKMAILYDRRDLGAVQTSPVVPRSCREVMTGWCNALKHADL